MTEEIKQKAEQYMRDFHNTELSETDLILFAEQLISETTKELQEKLKHRNCVDCSNHSGNLRMRNLELEKQIKKMKHYLNEFMRISVASVEEFEPEFSELVGEVETFLEK